MADSESICNGGRPLVSGGETGVFFPQGGKFESDLPDIIQAFLYLVGLFYCFAGVAMAADIFMASIEHITSKRIQKTDKKLGKKMTVNVWNATVANLTLMALGSSAPEILLSVIELFSNDIQSGELGPSTIVGSAAFNLMVIIAICVMAIPSDETRHIKELPVFGVTAFFSVFAYVWLIIILLIVSPDVVEWWEGVLTFMFFPVMCVLAYLADRGLFHKMFNLSMDGRKELVLSPDTSQEEMAEMMVVIRQKYGEDSEEHMEDLLKLEFHPKTSRAQHRCRAIHNMCASKKVMHKQFADLIKIKPVRQKLQALEEERKASVTIDNDSSEVTFVSHNYMVRESAGKVDIELLRVGNLESQATVRVKTEGGTAEENADYEALDEVVVFEKGEESKKVTIKIVQDDLPEDTEVFYVTLCSTSQSHPDTFANIGSINKCDVIIIDDDHPGKLRFDVESMDINENDQMQEEDIQVKVHRQKGTSGDISVKYRCEDVSAFEGRDYRCEEGVLNFASGQASAVFTVTILPKGRLEATEQFRIIIEDGSEGVEFDETTDGKADCCILTVNIIGSQQTKGKVTHLMGKLKPSSANMALGSENWKSQFMEAIYVGGSKEEQQQSGLTERVLHVILLPWKLLCAFVPPPSIFGGYPCFACSLLLIGFMTAMIGDLASLLGCALQVKDQITAITIVALGTSLPDTFASKSAAIHDDTADASIGNVTGSNSVNVFLGLGLPWMIASIYWEVVRCNLDDLTDPWVKRGHEAGWWVDLPHIKRDYPGRFVVPAGELGSNVAVFTVCALLTLMTLVLRRRFLGAELGGPAVAKYATGAFFVLLWCTYIGLFKLVIGG